MAALVPLMLSRHDAVRDAASEAVVALCSYNQDGKLAQLEGLVQALQRQPEAAGQVRCCGCLAVLVVGLCCVGGAYRVGCWGCWQHAD